MSSYDPFLENGKPRNTGWQFSGSASLEAEIQTPVLELSAAHERGALLVTGPNGEKGTLWYRSNNAGVAISSPAPPIDLNQADFSYPGGGAEEIAANRLVANPQAAKLSDFEGVFFAYQLQLTGALVGMSVTRIHFGGSSWLLASLAAAAMPSAGQTAAIQAFYHGCKYRGSFWGVDLNAATISQVASDAMVGVIYKSEIGHAVSLEGQRRKRSAKTYLGGRAA